MIKTIHSSLNTDYLMAIDAGTGSVRAVIFDTQGNQIAAGQSEWQHKAVEGINGSMEFDFMTNWPLICRCIRQALHAANLPPSAIAAVAASSMREGIVLYDRQGKALWGCANVDARSSQQVIELKTLYDHQFESLAYAKTGQTLALGALPRLRWLAQHRPDIYQQIGCMTMISDWIAAQLCDQLAVDPSNAGTSGILDLASRNWTANLLEQAGLRSDILPTVKETGTLLGYVTAQAAQESGLAPGTPVIVGGGDVQLGCLGLGVVKPAQAAVLGGTFWQQVVNLPYAITDPSMNVRINPHVIPGMAQAESISFFTGLVMRWFRDVFCTEEKSIAHHLGIDTYTLLEQMAERIPVGSYGVTPIFSDAMRFNKWYHAAPSFINLSINAENCNKATLFRALEENAAIVSSLNLTQVMQFSGVKLSSIVFAGGGAKGKLWSQILSDVTGLTVNVPKVKEATALGCAIAAGVGVGLFESLSSAGEQLVRWERAHTPNGENYEKYQAITENWLAIYSSQLKLIDLQLTTSLWKAPGL